MRPLVFAATVAALLLPAPAGAAVLTPAGTLTALQPETVVASDFNHDGDPDLAITDSTASGVRVFLGGSGRSFSNSVTYPMAAGTTSVAVADLNGDGDPDLIASNVVDDSASVRLGGVGGTFGAATTYAMGDDPTGVTTGDFNGDGAQDVATVNFTSQDVTVRFGAGDGTLGAPFADTTVSSALDLAAADVDGDGDLDIAVATAGAGTVGVMLNDGAGSFAAPVSMPAGTRPATLAFGDLNGDGDPDLVVGDDSNSQVRVFTGIGGSAFGALPPVSAGGSAVQDLAIADLDGDGRQDVVAANRDGVALLRGSGGGVAAATQFPATSFTWKVATADLDGDGQTDVVATDGLNSTVSLFRNVAFPILVVDQPQLAFGTQPLATLSAIRTLRATSVGDRALRVTAVRTFGADADDYLVIGDTCTGAIVPTGGSCEIRVRFAPQAAGARDAGLTIVGDSGAPFVGLSGTGGPLPTGPQGQTGAQGPAGSNGQDRDKLVAVLAAARQRAHARKRAKVGFVTTVAGRVTVALRRGKKTVARKSISAKAGRNTVTLKVPRRAGRYTVVLTARAGTQTATDRARLTVVAE